MQTAQYLVAGSVVADLITSASCFSYRKTETVEPPPSTVVEPVTPTTATEFSTTKSTTSDSDGQSVEKQQTTSAKSPGY
jgi:hypothetical protein